MSSEKALERLKAIIAKTVSRRSVFSIVADIEEEVKDFSFIHKGLKLKETEPSYELRIDLASKEWQKATEGLQGKMNKDKVEEITSKIRKVLRDKENLFVDDNSLPKERKYLSIKKSTQALAYVTTISDRRIFVKPIDNDGHELDVDQKEIPFSSCVLDEIVNPGDEVYVDTCDSESGRGENLTIIKCSELSIDCEKMFVKTLKEKLSSVESDSIEIFHEAFERCKGVWDYIKNDEKFLEEDENLKDFLRIAAELSKSETYRTMFLDDVSSSSFFIKFLPVFIEKNVKDLESNESIDITTLLNLIAEFFPSAAKRVLKVASCLAKALVSNARDADERHGHESCIRGIDLLANIGETLTKSIPGSEEVDPTNSAWHELPTILAQKELSVERDITGLQSVKEKGSYEGTDKYLETYHNLLREECYGKLHAGIRNFCENPKDHDPKKMNMYRIKLGSVMPTRSDVSIMLNYELYGAQEDDDNSQLNSNLLYGNLMCISLDKTFKQLIWATVGRSPKLEKTKNSNTRIVYVELCSKRNEIKDVEVLLRLHELTGKGDHALMAESPNFFKAFGPSIECLKNARITGDIPFKEEIIFCKKSIHPDYTHEKTQPCDWSIIFEKPTGCDFITPNEEVSPIGKFKILKESKVKSELDGTQLDAIQTFLENRVTLIQGPPGTGKSFLGAKILRLMLSMKIQERFKGPILVMTYKNYALDHFMDMCLEYCPETVRIGSSNENTSKQVKEINLNNICKKKAMRKELHDIHRSEGYKMGRLFPKLKEILEKLMNPVFTLDLFFKAAEKRHIDSLVAGSSESSSGDDQKKLTAKEMELVRKKLLEWLPKKELHDKYEAFLKRKNDFKTSYNESKGCPEDENSDENCDHEGMDPKVVSSERMQNADDYEIDGNYTSSESQDDDSGDDEIKVPLAFVAQKDAQPSLAKLRDVHNILELEPEDRVDFIYALQGKVMKENIDKFRKLLAEYKQCCKCRKDIWEMHKIDVLKKFKVIGMTITGAAIQSQLLSKIKPCAVIIEEAAEVLEGQLVSVLPPSIKHLVMLGDQEQLKPHVSCHELKRFKKLDCSMFERLINNELNYQQLGRQCRMHDNIAQLLRELKIYANLDTNKEKTQDNHPPKSTEKSMFFWTHTDAEKRASGTSRYNVAEIKKITEVASHLLKYDYSPNHITVLCAYRSQVERMLASFKEKSKDPQDESFTKLKEIKITTVDSFQGEENKVILLSLVRTKDRLGFMSQRNRICVAISRAQCALYIFGNSSHFGDCSRNWKIILEYLRRNKLFGQNFTLHEIKEKDEQRPSEQYVVNINSPVELVAVGDNNVINM